MAAPLSRSGTLLLMEDAAGLMRRVPAGALFYFFVGSVPFALGLLLAWYGLTQPRTSDAAWAGESLLLAALLIWMNCWRSVYALKLRQELSGTPETAWTARRVSNLVAIQALAGASKLLVLPLSALIVFPWANVVAFYRSLTVVAGREDLDPAEAYRRARQMARFHPGQSWAALALLFFFEAVLAVNLIAVLGLLPQLIRVLTGYESAFSRSGLYFVLNPVFFVLLLLCTWLLFDPYVQAVYSIRSFQAESEETGEDLRSGLRRIRAASAVLAWAAVLLTVGGVARADVAPADLEQAVHQAMQAPEYDWRFPPATAAAPTGWVASLAERVITAVRNAAEAAGRLLSRLVRWLIDRLFPRGAGQPGAPPPGRGLDWTVAALLVFVVAAGALFAWQRRHARGRAKPAPSTEAAAAVRLDSPDLSADALSEDQWLEVAEHYLAEQNFRFALRALYLSSLAWLGRREFLAIHPGKTNYEYEREFKRRTRGFAGACALFSANVAAFERAWYGLHAVTADEAQEFRRTANELRQTLTPSAGVAP